MKYLEILRNHVKLIEMHNSFVESPPTVFGFVMKKNPLRDEIRHEIPCLFPVLVVTGGMRLSNVERCSCLCLCVSVHNCIIVLIPFRTVNKI